MGIGGGVDVRRVPMISTLYTRAVVAVRDADLMHHLRQLREPDDLSTATMYRFGIVNDAGELYRLVIVFGVDERKAAVEVLQRLGYRQGGSNAERRLDAVYLQPAHDPATPE
jgi:hypothetical protein